jgi:hypothetical protein
MTVFQIDVYKIVGTEVWSNVYHVDVADISTARARAASILAAERAIHSTSVTFQGTRTRQAGVGHVGVIDLSGVAGQRAITGNKLPLFNCQRVDFENGSKRPGRKYLRGDWGSSDLGAATYAWGATAVTNLGTYADAILAVVGICDPQGRPFTARSVIAAVAMHQLKRGNRSPIP